MEKTLEITLLGSGCSSGVPRIDGYWGNCDPSNPKNRRLRCSALISLFSNNDILNSTNIIIDTSPDFRAQILAAKVNTLNAVLWTHDHADQTHGIDDLRFLAQSMGKRIEGFMDKVTYDSLSKRFSYIFEGAQGYEPICKPHIIPPHGQPWTVNGLGGDLDIITFNQSHGSIDSVGYRVNDVAYSSDVSDLSDESFDALSDLKLWVVDALRYKPHPTHAHLEKTLSWIERVKPQKAILTNLHQDMDYDALGKLLPDNVSVGYDMLKVQV